MIIMIHQYLLISFIWQVVIGMDVAASEFYSEKDKTYDLNFKEDVRSACSFLSNLYLHIVLCVVP